MEECDNHYYVTINNAEDDSVVYGYDTKYAYLDDASDQMCDYVFIITVWESGTYYFTVQALGDNVNTSDSDIARSENWTYTKPSISLAAPAGVKISYNNELGEVEATWEPVEGNHGYAVEWYFSSETQEKKLIESVYTFNPNHLSDELTLYMLQEYGAGSYYARVRAFSKDILTVSNSGWSEMSNAYIFDGSSGGTTPAPAPAPAAVISNDRTYAPIRYLAEFFGCEVGWDAAAKTVIIN